MLSIFCPVGILVVTHSFSIQTTGTNITGNLLLLALLVGIALFCLLMMWQGVRVLSGSLKRVFLCDEGFVAHNGRQMDLMRWDQIATASRYWVRRRKQSDGPNQTYYQDHPTRYFTYHCCVRRRDDYELTIDASDYQDGGEDLCREIARQVMQKLLPQTLAAYRSGRPISFDDLIVSKQGLSKDQGRSILPWSTLDRIQVGVCDEMIIWLRQAGGPQQWDAKKRLPNAPLFLELARAEGITCEHNLSLPDSSWEDLLASLF